MQVPQILITMDTEKLYRFCKFLGAWTVAHVLHSDIAHSTFLNNLVKYMIHCKMGVPKNVSWKECLLHILLTGKNAS